MKKQTFVALLLMLAASVLLTFCSKDIELPEVVVNLDVSPVQGLAPLKVKGRATNVSGQVTSYSWNFGDGYTASGEEAEHTYSTAGNYTVRLTVTGSEGSEKKPNKVTKVLEQVVRVAQAPTLPNADFQYSPTNNIIAGQTPVTFTSTSTGTIHSWSWNFGSGESVLNIENPVYIFKTAGNKTVSHTASGPLGYSITSKSVTVHAMDPACNNYNSGTTHSASAIQALRNSNQVKYGKLRIQNNYNGPVYVEMYYPDYWLAGDYKPVWNVYWTVNAGTTTTLTYQNTPLSIGTDWGVRVRFTNGVISCVRTVADVSTYSNGEITVNAVKTYNGN